VGDVWSRVQNKGVGDGRMIQPLFDGMIAILLAKFVINDLPHAAGLTVTSAAIHRNPNQLSGSRCSPERMPSWTPAQNIAKERPEYNLCLNRATDYLNTYCEFASEEHPSDELVDRMYTTVEKSVVRAIAVNWGDHFGYPEEKVGEFFVDPLGYISRQPKPPYPAKWHTGEAVWHYRLHFRLVEFLRPAILRIDKVEVIEAFTYMMHHNWPVITYAFSEYVEVPYRTRVGAPVKIRRTRVMPGDISLLVKETLDCLMGE